MTRKGVLGLLSAHHHHHDGHDLPHDRDSDHHHHRHSFLSMLSPRHHHRHHHEDEDRHRSMLAPEHNHNKSGHDHHHHDHHEPGHDDHHHHRHGIKSILSRLHLHHRHHHDHPPLSPGSPSSLSVSAGIIYENINAAESIISNWDAETNSYAKITPLFSGDRAEAHQFLRAVADLQNAMLFFVNDELGGASVSGSHALVRAQSLMQTAMRRLERELYQILSANRDQLDPESISTYSSHSSISAASEGGEDADEEIQAAGKFIDEIEHASVFAIADLCAIADAMIFAGYGKECIKIYKVLRKSIVDEGLYRLGFENPTPSQVHKLDWEMLELKIRSWISAARVAVKTLFSGERILCDHVFGGSGAIRESCFADVAKDAAVHFFEFAESVTKTKRSSEKIIPILQLFDTISDLWPEIESIFSYESTSVVRSQAQASLQKLREAARSILADFEAAIQKDAMKSLPSGAGIHMLTRYAVNYIVPLADYDAALAEIFADMPMPAQSPITDFFLEAPPSPSPTTATSSSSLLNEGIQPTIAARLARLLLVLFCKLDSKAGMYRDAAISYLFLANNQWFMVRRARESKLGYLLGEGWVDRHEAKARQNAGNYARIAWGKVSAEAAAAAEQVAGPAEAREWMRGFNAALEEAIRSQREIWIEEEGLKEEVRAGIEGMILPGYRILYERFREFLQDSGAVRFPPDAVSRCLSSLFEEVPGSGAAHGSPKPKPWSG